MRPFFEWLDGTFWLVITIFFIAVFILAEILIDRRPRAGKEPRP